MRSIQSTPKKKILKKLNSFLGYNAVERLKFTLFEDKEPNTKKIINKYATNNKYKQRISSIKNDKVKNSLMEFIKHFKKK